MPRWVPKFLKKKRKRARVVYTETGTRKRGGKSRGRKRSGEPWYKRKKTWTTLGGLGLIGAFMGGIVLLIVAMSLPNIDQLTLPKKQHGIRVVNEEGKLIGTYGDIYGDTIPYEEMPKTLIAATIATEDRRFFQHGGIDIWGIIRAMAANVAHGHVVQGGSTITQQLAKNMFLTPERTLKRKLQEVVLAFYLEGRYSKKEIISIYLNRVYMGAGAYGADAASRRYFNKGARDLTLPESAMLAGLLKAPSRYAPTSSAQRAHERTTQVLVNMEDAGYLTKAQVKQAEAEMKDTLTSKTVEGNGTQYFTDWVVDSLPDYIGDVDEDLVVTTTLGPMTQQMAEEAVTDTMATEGPAKNISQAALLAMSPDGAVRAMVGGINYATSQFNRATQAKRQAGSTFKLFVYLTALEEGYTPQSLVLDAPITLRVGNKLWSPQNFEKGYEGQIPLYEAIKHSINTAAVRVVQAVGDYKVASMAKRLGVSEAEPRPSIALGAEEVSLIELTGAFAHLPNGGRSVKPYAILKIATTGGDVLYQRENVDAPQVLSSNVVEMIDFMLEGVVRGGTGGRASLGGRDVAGKTGTSQDFKDAWFMGFTPQLVTGVWVGNDNNAPMKAVTGGNVPAMIWHNFMVKALADKPVLRIPANDGTGGLLNFFGGAPAIPDEYGNQPQVQPDGTTPDQQQPLPQNVPFGYAHPPLEQQQQVPQEQPQPQPQAQPQPEGENGDVLDGKFWNQLYDEAKKKKVQYSYPDNR